MQSHEAPRAFEAILWVVVLLVAALVLALTGYETRDPDSRAYTAIAAELANQPVSRWIAPEWWGAWGFTGPFREHPIGILIVPAMLVHAGYPAAQASLLASAAFQIVCLALAVRLAARFVGERDARALLWTLQIIPIAFVFRIRANQEYAWLAGLLLALYATDRARTSRPWALAGVVAFVWALLVKGVFALLVPPLCALWLWARWGTRRMDAGAWLGIAAMAIVAPLAAGMYEFVYRRVTGGSFLDYYLGDRLALDPVGDQPLLLRKAYNLVWYVSRVLWYAAPWSFVVVTLPWLTRRTRTLARGIAASADGVRGLSFALAAAALVVVAVALRDTKADRYVFPAYYFLAAAGSLAAIRYVPAMAAFTERLDRYPLVIGPALWLLLFGLRVFSGQGLPGFTFWRS
jgi:4-amino-4-deoxy-L-arabinose transferase-like glycosyltransferase